MRGPSGPRRLSGGQRSLVSVFLITETYRTDMEEVRPEERALLDEAATEPRVR